MTKKTYYVLSLFSFAGIEELGIKTCGMGILIGNDMSSCVHKM